MVTAEDIEQLVAEAPDNIRKLREHGKPLHVNELFTTEHERQSIMKTGKTVSINSKGGSMEVGALVDKDGYVMAMAAKVIRQPTASLEYVKNISDFSTNETDTREAKIPVWHRIYLKEGVINNAVNKTAAFVSAEGEFYIRRAKQGNRKTSKVKEELKIILDFWKRKVNSRNLDGAVTSAKGLSSLIDQATRQALIEGSWVGYLYDSAVDIPSLGKTYNLPIYVQSFSSQYIKIPDVLVGTDLEQFLWEPPRDFINKITNVRDARLKPIIQEAFPTEIITELKKNRNVLLDPARVWHVKHRGVNTEAFGESLVEPVVSDLAYKRALQALDFVTIDSLVNRVLIVKVGSDKPDSEYHNLEFAQQRLQVLKRLFDTVDPNMNLLWAGPDIDVVDVGAHNSIAELDGRWAVAHERIFMALGIPRTLLTGEAAQGQAWAGYEGYRETLRSLQNMFKETLETIGERIAEANGFEGTEISFEFNRTLLADQTASADLSLRSYQAGLSSLRRTVPALGGDFDTERRNMAIEKGLEPDSDNLPPDSELFTPPEGMPGATKVGPDGNIKAPGGEPGRRPDSQRAPLSPERPSENKNPRDGK